MIDFKPIEEFTFDDCVRSLDRYRSEGVTPDDELLQRYNSLLMALQAEEERDYLSANVTGISTQKKIEGLEHFIKKYSNLSSASRYEPRYLNDAQQELERFKRKRKAKKKKIHMVVSAVIIILAIMTGVFFIGYRPVSYFYVSQSSVTFSKGVVSDTIILYTDVSEIDIEERVGWLDVSKDGKNIIMKADRNKGDLRMDVFEIIAYPMFFDKRIDLLKKSLAIYVKQEDGYATYLDVDSVYINFSPEGGNRNIYVRTDGVVWGVDGSLPSWLSATKNNSYIELSASENLETNVRDASLWVWALNANSDTIISGCINISQDYYYMEASAEPAN